MVNSCWLSMPQNINLVSSVWPYGHGSNVDTHVVQRLVRSWWIYSGTEPWRSLRLYMRFQTWVEKYTFHFHRMDGRMDTERERERERGVYIYILHTSLSHLIFFPPRLPRHLPTSLTRGHGCGVVAFAQHGKTSPVGIPVATTRYHHVPSK